MILDNNLEFADALATATGNVDTLEGDVIDLQSLGGAAVGSQRDPGNGEPLYLVIQVTTAFTGDATVVEFTLASDATAAIAVDGTASEHVKIGPFTTAQLTADRVFAVALPIEGNVYERFLGLIVERNGTTGITAGALNAFLTLDVQAWKAYTGVTGAVS